MVSIDDLKIGTVVDILDPYSTPPKRKYSIIIAVAEDKFYIGTVYINTEVNVLTINSPELVSLQHEIHQIKYIFLQHDSFVDCSDMKPRLQSELLRQLSDGGRIVGRIAKDDVVAINTLVRSADTIMPYYKKLCNLVEYVYPA